MGCRQSSERDTYGPLQPIDEPLIPATEPKPEPPKTVPDTTSSIPSTTTDPDMGAARSRQRQAAQDGPRAGTAPSARKEEATTQSRSAPKPASSAPVQKSAPPPVAPPPVVKKEPAPAPPAAKPAEKAAAQNAAPAKPSSTKPTSRLSRPTTSSASMQRPKSRTDVPQPDSTSGLPFEELYKLEGVLGTGAFSTVREGKHRNDSSGTTYAVKCVNRAKLTDEDAAALLDEVAILREFNHPHIIRLFDFFEDPSTYYLVMERMCGGELFDRIVAKAYYNEKEARDTCKILLEAVGYCHANKVAHRDLKPENLLLLSDEDDSTVKIADFGFAKRVYEPRSLTTQCGTPGYVAPEILEGVPYDTKADMWSVGVILYILLGGYPPFIENNQRELFRKIRKGDYEFHEEYWGTVTQEAKDLISALLTVDPSRRLTADKALKNKWILGDDEELAHKDLGVNLQEFKKFNAKRKFKAAVSTVMAVNKLQSLGQDFLKNLD